MRLWHRKRVETVVLALIGIGTVIPLRLPVESTLWFALEFFLLTALAVGSELLRWRNQAEERPRRRRAIPLMTAGLPLVAVTCGFLARVCGSPIAFEMTALSAFGAGGLALALAAGDNRSRAMSMVASGFMVLFATSISDHSQAIVAAILWMALGVWHLIANHWERLDVCLPDSVRTTVAIRPASVLVAVLLCVFAGLLVRNHVGDSAALSIGVMPTSGGSRWSDPAARSGVGSGDAAIAAKDHANAFGAVDSDIFLESNESTLFDLLSDTIGEPKLKPKWERRQGLGTEDFIPNHEKINQTEQGSGSLSIRRKPPEDKHDHFKGKRSAAIVQWVGPTGIRLAMERYDTFDGVAWSNQANHRRESLKRWGADDNTWFFDPQTLWQATQPEADVAVNLLKVIRLASPRLPAPMMTSGLHIKDLDREDFFGIEDDGSFFMPGRDKVPPLTVVHLASLNVSEDELLRNTSGSGEAAGDAPQPEIALPIREWLESIAVDRSRPRYEQLQAVVSYLRREFVFDRSVAVDAPDVLAEFWRTRRGGDHLFATLAALFARELGYESRLVTGFYVRPESHDLGAGHADVIASDVHVWVELKLDEGRWFEIEPTPGYRPPEYNASWSLIARRAVATYWPHALVVVMFGSVLYRTRIRWMELILSASWRLTGWLRPQRQLSIAMRIVESRARLVGRPRPAGVPQRDWMESLTRYDAELHHQVRTFCDAADRTIFGNEAGLERINLTPVVRRLTARTLEQLSREGAS